MDKELQIPTKPIKKKEVIIIKTSFNNEDFEFKFRKPTKLIYSLILQDYSKGKLYEIAETIIKNCLIKEEDDSIDLINDLPFIAHLMGDLATEILNLKSVKIDTNVYKGSKYKTEYAKLKKQYPYIFVVTVDEKYVMFLKPLTREHYRNVFNKSANDLLSGLNYIYQNLNIGGDDLYSDDDVYMSCFNLGDYLVTYKEVEIKKK